MHLKAKNIALDPSAGGSKPSWLVSLEPYIEVYDFTVHFLASIMTIGLAIGTLTGTLFAAFLILRKVYIRLFGRVVGEVLAPLEPDFRIRLSRYVEPDSTSVNPADFETAWDFNEIRQNIFVTAMNAIQGPRDTKFFMILSDTGTGKTSFCWSLSKRLEKKRIQHALLSLSQDSSIERIKGIENPEKKVLILDALDESVEALADYDEFHRRLFQSVSEFHTVFITCRSQFFRSDRQDRLYSGVRRITPVSAAGGKDFIVQRFYIAPFTLDQIAKYIRKTPIWESRTFVSRKSIREKAKLIGDLSSRPMLLELIPALVQQKSQINEVFALYEFMVGRWLERECKESGDNWNEVSLRSVSGSVAIEMWSGRTEHNRRMSEFEMHSIVQQTVPDRAWQIKFGSRSLLNRDARGFYRFAHSSIYEFLVVCEALNGNENAFNQRWTHFMIDLLRSKLRMPHDTADLDGLRRLFSMPLEHAGIRQIFSASAHLYRKKMVSVSEILARQFDIIAEVGISVSTIEALFTSTTHIAFVSNGLLEIEDRLFGLKWEVMSPEIINSEDGTIWLREYPSDKAYLVDRFFETNYGNAWTLPTFSEFLLLEIYQKISSRPVLWPNTWYWLGDNVESGFRLAVIVEQTVEQNAETVVVGEMVHPTTGRRLTVAKRKQAQGRRRAGQLPRAIAISVFRVGSEYER